MHEEALLRHLTAQTSRMVASLEQAVMLESPSTDRAAASRMGDWLAQAFADQGARVARLPPEGKGAARYADHLRAVWEPPEGRTGQVLLLGHFDTVWDVGTTEARPFHHDPHTGRATGPGVFDMKGGLVIGLFALRALRDLGLAPPCQLLFLLNSDEETGSPTSRRLIEAEAGRSDYVLVLEPSREAHVVTWRKGVGRYSLEITGRAAHSGAAHASGVSAVRELAYQVLRLEGLTNYEQGITVNVGWVQGGTRVNVVPAHARAEVDLRVMTARQGRRLERAILNLTPADPDVRLQVTGGMNRPPWERSPQGVALFRRAQAVGRSLGLELLEAGAGGGSDGNFAAALGVPTLDGLGVVGDGAHADDEWAATHSLPLRAALLAALLLALN
jgi:glutamate carboxypeptidase